MFTGLIEGKGEVRAIRRIRNDIRMTIDPIFEMNDCRVGDSICIDGVCLTVTDMSKADFSVDVSMETITRSTLGMLRQGDEVNLERALRLSDRLGGHFVSGHVDGTGKILKKEQQQGSWIVRIGVDEKISRYIIKKGSIAVDGISLTVNQYEESFFEVNIIPQTGRETTLLKKNVGEVVNIETDLIGKYLEKFALRDISTREEKMASSINLKMLARHGFGD